MTDDEEPTAALHGGTGEHRVPPKPPVHPGTGEHRVVPVISSTGEHRVVPSVGGTGEHRVVPSVGGTGEHRVVPHLSGTGEHRVVPPVSGTGEHRIVARDDEPALPLAGAFPGVPASGGIDLDPPKDPLTAAPDDGPRATPVVEETNSTSPDPSISAAPGKGDLDRPARRRPAPAGTLIWVLLALLGFTLVVQLRSNDADDGLSAARQEDLVRILSDLEAQDSRLLAEIQGLEQSKQQLTSGVAGREAARAEAEKRSQELGLLAGTVPGRGPGLDITLTDVRASDVLNAVQELRGAGGEVMQLNGANGGAVRVVASSFFVDASGGGIIADGDQLTGPFHLLVIGPSGTMSTALQIPGGVVASAKNDGGSVTMDSRSMVEVSVVRKAAALRYARPVS
ncbi:DUF881 domain-containing protein [Actinoplanes couchii]|uniref:Division initiation protein n=1 Tax=Actinoplanes couchii TaxID=403638 RepID=A0ABQ3X1B0_9ACTN|nr:DUF881 domain-containing protein [Actinoplanes couchii]MDR6316706.1 uncharacterized protein YlxW (UPF0749 family) [Actinoplanes couchii]GID52315.1 hypothetical protein Aco03nite_007190 [Actinoplanes couchii]